MDKPLDKEAIRKALEAASPGPWVPYWDGVVQFFNVPNGAYMFPADDFEREDAHLITHAPTWLRALLEENERLTEERDKLQTAFQNVMESYARVEKDMEDAYKRMTSRAIQAEQERDAMHEYIATIVNSYHHVMTYGLTQEGIRLIQTEKEAPHDRRKSVE